MMMMVMMMPSVRVCVCVQLEDWVYHRCLDVEARCGRADYALDLARFGLAVLQRHEHAHAHAHNRLRHLIVQLENFGKLVYLYDEELKHSRLSFAAFSSLPQRDVIELVLGDNLNKHNIVERFVKRVLPFASGEVVVVVRLALTDSLQRRR